MGSTAHPAFWCVAAPWLPGTQRACPTTASPSCLRLPTMLCSGYSPSNDLVLSYISSFLATHPHSAASASSLASAAPSMAGGSSSGAIELRSDARMWEVQWAELTILRLIGHGSYGAVYLAEWNQTSVAVKVLVGKGK